MQQQPRLMPLVKLSARTQTSVSSLPNRGFDPIKRDGRFFFGEPENLYYLSSYNAVMIANRHFHPVTHNQGFVLG